MRKLFVIFFKKKLTNRRIAIFSELDLICVIERDTHRAQILSLPTFEQLAVFGEADLKRPYGISIVYESRQDTAEDRHALVRRRYSVYITDNYINEIEKAEPAPGESEEEKEHRKKQNRRRKVPAASMLGNRVKHYSVVVEAREKSEDAQAAHELKVSEVALINSFGETGRDGALHKVESIAVDSYHGRILVADEIDYEKNVKIYDMNGRFTGTKIGAGVFDHEPEGIAIYECPEGRGYYVMTDQHKKENRFYVFDRVQMKLLGTFMGKEVSNTDGITLTQKAFGKFFMGAFYAVHADGSVGAFSLSKIFKALSLKELCVE